MEPTDTAPDRLAMLRASAYSDTANRLLNEKLQRVPSNHQSESDRRRNKCRCVLACTRAACKSARPTRLPGAWLFAKLCTVLQ
jgi:hypothetical protein